MALFTIICFITIVIIAFIIIVTVVLLLALVVPLAICLVKRKRRDISRLPKVDINYTYGTYSLSEEMTDYSTVEDTNDYYGK